MNSLYK